MRRDKIYLVGFAASGKSTVARRLASRLGWRAFDIDDLVEQRESRSISEIFSEYGEPYYRAVEREILRGLLMPRQAVVATGSGTFADGICRALIAGDGLSVWLDAPIDVLIGRLPAGRPRPLGDDRRELERVYQLRGAAYRLADLRLDAGAGSADELVERVLDWIGY